jgi:predicted HicB family RNase H-like nuclease
MSIDRKANRILEEAKDLANKVKTWADFSAALFDQFRGIVAKTFTSDVERQAFYDSEQYKQIQRIQTDLMKKFGIAQGATPKETSGRFVVRIPKSLHQTLRIDAKREGVSLNTLATTKLAVPLPRSSGFGKTKVIEAFNEVHEGHSADWVVIDPRLNGLYLSRCRKLGLINGAHTEFSLNHLLLNIRKNNRYKGWLRPTTERMSFQTYDDCAFAAEIAIRTLQRTEGASLDRIICDPELRKQFDELAGGLVTNTVIKLRSAALHLRKTHRLMPRYRDMAMPTLVTAGSLKQLSIFDIEPMPGTYALYDDKRPIYAGETENLRHRVEMHRKGGFPEWIESNLNHEEGVILKYSMFPSASRDDRLKWLGSFINQEKPLLNYQSAA